MSVNVMEVSDPDVFSYLMSPRSHPATFEYIQNQYNSISHSLLDSGRQFIQAGKQLADDFCNGVLEKAAAIATRVAGFIANPNQIHKLRSLEDIQCAPPLMQRYIMAEPYLRDKYHEQLCSGYGDTYLDQQPGISGAQHYDYRRINNGVIHFKTVDEDDDSNTRWVSTTYFEELKDGDRDLTFLERMDIIATQQLAVLFAKAGEDPTCVFGGEMG